MISGVFIIPRSSLGETRTLKTTLGLNQPAVPVCLRGRKVSDKM